jgi:epoxyqueuosine reductase QueG
MGGRQFQRAFAGTALMRAGRHRLLRNVICALANAVASDELSPQAAFDFLERASSDHRAEVAAHASRALAGMHDPA